MHFRNEDLSDYVKEVSERHVEETVDFSLFNMSVKSWLLIIEAVVISVYAYAVKNPAEMFNMIPSKFIPYLLT
jgi:hypothetical protein